MARIRNREDFKSSILLRLGEPVVNLVVQQYGSIDCATTATTGSSGTSGTDNPSTSGSPATSGCPQIVSTVLNQLDIVIDDALDYFKNASTGASNEEDILLLQMEEGRCVYPVCDNVLAVEQPLSSGSGSLGFGDTFDHSDTQSKLFSWQNTMGSTGMYGLSTKQGSEYDNLLTMEIAMEYASLIEMRYMKKFEVQFNDYSKEILVFPTPKAEHDGKVIAMVTHREVSDEKCFRDLWLQEYSTALLSIQVGRNTSMFDGAQLPGGMSYNSQFYYDNGITERDRLIEKLDDGSYGNNESGSSFFTG